MSEQASSSNKRSSSTKRPTLVQQTMRQLMHDLMHGVYGPGQRIPEVELAERLGVSRAPVREALHNLERDGLVRQTPRRGTRVIDPAPEDIDALFDLVGAVYGVVARRAAEQASDEQLARMSRNIERFASAEADGRPMIELLDAAYQVATHLGQICGSATAAETLRRLGRSAYWAHRYLGDASSRWRQQSVKRFHKLEAALLARAGHRSETAARQLVAQTQRLLRKQLSLPRS